jgi:hypothetical protein
MTNIDWDNIDPDSPEAQHLMENFQIHFKSFPPDGDTVELRQLTLGINQCILIEPEFTEDTVGFTITVSGMGGITSDNIKTIVADQLTRLADLIDHDYMQPKT